MTQVSENEVDVPTAEDTIKITNGNNNYYFYNNSHINIGNDGGNSCSNNFIANIGQKLNKSYVKIRQMLINIVGCVDHNWTRMSHIAFIQLILAILNLSGWFTWMILKGSLPFDRMLITILFVIFVGFVGFIGIRAGKHHNYQYAVAYNGLCTIQTIISVPIVYKAIVMYIEFNCCYGGYFQNARWMSYQLSAVFNILFLIVEIVTIIIGTIVTGTIGCVIVHWDICRELGRLLQMEAEKKRQMTNKNESETILIPTNQYANNLLYSPNSFANSKDVKVSIY